MRRSRASILAVTTVLALISACDRQPISPVPDDERFGGSPGAVPGTLTGYIAVDSVRPAVGVAIHIFASGATNPTVTVLTDQNGIFTANVEAGAYDVVMVVPAGLYRAPNTPERISVHATANATVQVHGFALTATEPPIGGGIDGALLKGESRVEGLGPVPGTVVTIRKDGTELQRTSDANGLFEFGVVEAGQWELVTTPPTGYILADGERSPRPLNFVRKGDSLFIQVDLATADGTGRIRVQAVADSATALPGVIVRAIVGNTVVAEVTTNSQVPASMATLVLQPGNYTIEAVPPAGYELLPGHSARVDNVIVRTGRLEFVAFTFRSTG